MKRMPKMATDLFHPNTPENLAIRCIQIYGPKPNGRAQAKLKRYRHSPSLPAKALDLLIKPTHPERTNQSFPLPQPAPPLPLPIAKPAIGETGSVPANRSGGGGRAGPNPLFSKEEGERHHPMPPPRERNRPRKWIQGESGPCPQRPHWRKKASLDDEDFRDWRNFSLSRWKADRALILDRHLGAFAVNLENDCRNRTNAMCDRSPPPGRPPLSKSKTHRCNP